MTTTAAPENDIDVAELTALIEEIERLPVGDHKDTKDPATQARLQRAGRLVTRMWKLGMIARWTDSQLRRTDLGRGYYEDLLQSTCLHFIRTLAMKEPGWLASRSGHAHSVLFNLAGQAATAAAENYSERFGVGGATNVYRRSQKYRVAEAKLTRELGREPHESEVIERLNADPRAGVREARWDGRNHRLPVFSDELNESDATVDDRAEITLTAAHAMRTIATVLRQTHPNRPELVLTLNAWFAGLQSGQIAVEDDRAELVSYMVIGRPADAREKAANRREIAEHFEQIDLAVASYRNAYGD